MKRVSKMIQYDSYKHDVHPGHPLVIAICIMQKYESLEAASSPSQGRSVGEDGKAEIMDYPIALGDSDIPGCGSSVCSALDLLSMASADIAIKFASICWEGECSGAYQKYYNKGTEASKELEPLFRELWARWKNNA